MTSIQDDEIDAYWDSDEWNGWLTFEPEEDSLPGLTSKEQEALEKKYNDEL